MGQTASSKTSARHCAGYSLVKSQSQSETERLCKSNGLPASGNSNRNRAKPEFKHATDLTIRYERAAWNLSFDGAFFICSLLASGHPCVNRSAFPSTALGDPPALMSKRNGRRKQTRNTNQATKLEATVVEFIRRPAMASLSTTIECFGWS